MSEAVDGQDWKVLRSLAQVLQGVGELESVRRQVVHGCCERNNNNAVLYRTSIHLDRVVRVLTPVSVLCNWLLGADPNLTDSWQRFLAVANQQLAAGAPTVTFHQSSNRDW